MKAEIQWEISAQHTKSIHTVQNKHQLSTCATFIQFTANKFSKNVVSFAYCLTNVPNIPILSSAVVNTLLVMAVTRAAFCWRSYCPSLDLLLCHCPCHLNWNQWTSRGWLKPQPWQFVENGQPGNSNIPNLIMTGIAVWALSPKSTRSFVKVLRGNLVWPVSKAAAASSQSDPRW